MYKLLVIFSLVGFGLFFGSADLKAQNVSVSANEKPKLGIKSLTFEGQSTDNSVMIPKKGGRTTFEAVLSVSDDEFLRGATVRLLIKRNTGTIRLKFKNEKSDDDEEAAFIYREVLIVEPGRDIPLKFSVIAPDDNESAGDSVIEVGIFSAWKTDNGKKIQLITDDSEKDPVELVPEDRTINIFLN